MLTAGEPTGPEELPSGFLVSGFVPGSGLAPWEGWDGKEKLLPMLTRRVGAGSRKPHSFIRIKRSQKKEKKKRKNRHLSALVARGGTIGASLERRMEIGNPGDTERKSNSAAADDRSERRRK